LSFEALSRGAKNCTALDNHHEAISHLATNSKMLGSDLNILHTDAISCLSKKNLHAPYNIAFVDPPFAGTLYREACALLEENQWLTASAMIYCEISSNSVDFSAPDNWRLEKDKTTGDVRYMLYSRFETSS
jgi:16S rRNA (guanine966-N2)-methyltransferase